MLGLPFMSPTVNMFIEDEYFVKLTENPEYYLTVEPYKIKESSNGRRCPVIGLDDIELCCLHYKSCDEAIEFWNRRKTRVDFNRILVIANSWNMHGNKELMQRVLNCGYPSIVYTYGDFGLVICFIEVNAYR